jgi:hypothetical protein
MVFLDLPQLEVVLENLAKYSLLSEDNRSELRQIAQMLGEDNRSELRQIAQMVQAAITDGESLLLREAFPGCQDHSSCDPQLL